jgi:hypothetical protein
VLYDPAVKRVLGFAAAAMAALVCALPADAAAAPLKGTVKRAYTTGRPNGKVSSAFKTTTTHVYASFVWLRAPTAGQNLEIDWFGPSGQRVARWRNKTLASDTAGTRIYSFIGQAQLKTRPGKWRVTIVVGGVERAALRFTVAKPAKR